MTHKQIGLISQPVETNIKNILTMAEAAYRWDIVENDIKTRLRIKNASDSKVKELRYLESIGYLKYFKPYEITPEGKQARGTWLVSVELMKLWFGEPVINEPMHCI